MKHLIIVRHAKTLPPEHGQKDFDRALNERGKKDAPEMGARLFGDQVIIEAFVSSPAKRAKQTCKAFMEAYGRNKDEIIFVDKLYNAPKNVFYETVNDLDDTYNSAALFAHNPGITDFVNSLCKDVDIDQMPTCAVFAVLANADHWTEFKDAEKKFLFFKYPKQF